MRRRCSPQLGPRSAPRSLHGELRSTRDRFCRPVAVQSLGSCRAKQCGHTNNGDGPVRPLGDAVDAGSALDNAPGTASRTHSELEIPASRIGRGRSRQWKAHDAPGHNQVSRRLERQTRCWMTTTGLRMRVEVRGRIEPQCGAPGPGPRSFGPEGAAPSLESLVAIFNDARRSLVGQTGGFSL